MAAATNKATNAEPSEADHAVLAAHERMMRATNDAIAEGYDPKLIAEGLATTAASALVQTHGWLGAARVLLACYVPVRDQVVALQGKPSVKH